MTKFLRGLLSVGACITISSISAFCGTIPGQDAYMVHQAEKTLPNGTVIPSSAMRINRPAPGTVMPGVVYVKTRVNHGIHKQSTTLQGSTVNATMGMTGVVEVSNAFAANTLPPSSKNLVEVLGLDRIYTVRYTEPMEAFDVCAKLMDDPDVEYACPVMIHKTSFTPNDPRYPTQGYLTKLGMAQAWDISKGDAKTIIAIVDSGTDWTHEDLASKIFTNTKEIPGNGKDDDGNGYVDDVRGWDFVGNVATNEVLSGITRPDNDPKVNWSPMNDQLGHGTSTAGLAAAATDNDKGIAAPGFNCTILPIKCGSDNPGPGGIFKGYDAIRYAADMGAHVINCSWGGPGIDPLGQDIIDYATAKGALVVAASGNDGLDNDSYLQAPAAYRGVLCVGSVNNNDAVSNFTNYGWNVSVYAPGESTITTYPGNNYKANSGTSFSSPITAGIAGLVKSLHPTWTPEMIYHQLRSTVDILPTGVGANRPKYYGRVNAYRALSINASFTSGQRMPGIGIASFAVQGGSTISSYAPQVVNLVFKNYLADASETTINYSVLSASASITSATDVSIPGLPNNATSTQKITVQLKPSYPWYSSFVEVGVTIKSGLYTNFERVRIPVQLPTQNVQTVLAALQNTAFTHASIAPDNALWTAGLYLNSPAFALITPFGSQIFQSLPFAATAFIGVSGTTAFVGGIRANAAKVSRTTNSGSQWTETDVASAMTAVRGFAMWDANSGIVVGDPISSKLGIMKTTNAGATWSTSTTVPAVATGEKIVAGAVYANATGIWCGTTNDRVLYSTNQGANWGTGTLSIGAGQILSVAFQDDKIGVALYRTGGAGSAVKIASSTTGGSTWTLDVFNPSTLEIQAVKVTSPGKYCLMIGSNGEVYATEDAGKTWQPVLSRSAGNVTVADARQSSRNTVLFGGDKFSVLQYNYTTSNGTKILESNSNSVDFGAVPMGSSRQRILQFTSAGESPVTITGYTITPSSGTPDTAFQISIPLKDVFPPGTASLGIRCYGSDTGTYRATLKVLSNSEKPVADAQLTARVDPPTSVEDDRLQAAIVSPNPASTELNIHVKGQVQLFIHDLNGRLVASSNTDDSGNANIDVRSLNVGVYQLTIASKLARTSKFFTITR
ncbi:MAG: S8 family serine peptidase [Ignavibacteria bacterium]|nr:S8 family serine peptidase [Ignavibacteria bacterium]